MVELEVDIKLQGILGHSCASICRKFGFLTKIVGFLVKNWPDDVIERSPQNSKVDLFVLYPFDLMKADVRDVDVSLVVDGQAVGNVEHALSEGLHHVAVVRIQNQDGVFVDHFFLLQFVVRAEQPEIWGL